MRAIHILLAFLLVGCSSIQGIISSPIQADSQHLPASGEIPQYQVWASGSFAWDDVEETLKFVPDRTGDAHFDVWPMLNPPNCYDCITMEVVSHDLDEKILTVDVTLRNPTSLTGWFVRGVITIPYNLGVELLNPDGWWHSDSQYSTQPPSAFKLFTNGDPDWPFGPQEAHTVTYELQYVTLNYFSSCKYSVIVRFPKDPGEPTFIGNEILHGALTKPGGFVTVRADMQTEATSPPVNVERQLAYPAIGPGPWDTMRSESGDTYLGWVMGDYVPWTYADIWVRAQVKGNGENYLAYRIPVEIHQDPPVPNRTFPAVSEGVSVFVDQLTTQMTDEQKEFMATNCVGSQKLVKNLADSMRVYNPEFIVVQYHLAFGEGDISNIHGNDWVKNWDFVDAQDDFFEHRTWSTQPNQRVLQQDWNWYLTDPTSDWVMYFIGDTIERMDPLGDQFDGVFADSASQPWNTDPSKWWEGSDDPHDMFTYWTPKTQEFFDTVVDAFHTLPTYYYLIPNAGSYVTTISDITYYQCDGVMIEGFAHWGPGNYFTEDDWQLQMNRIRPLSNSSKIILCQTDVEVENTLDRSFVLGSYAMVLDQYTYLNMLGPWGLEPQWWPEYSWNYGAPLDGWSNISWLQDAGGCYVREFENGIVIVNPSDEIRYYDTTKMYSHTMWAEGGLLPADGIPTGVATGPLVEPGTQEIAPYSAWFGAG